MFFSTYVCGSWLQIFHLSGTYLGQDLRVVADALDEHQHGVLLDLGPLHQQVPPGLGGVGGVEQRYLGAVVLLQPLVHLVLRNLFDFIGDVCEVSERVRLERVVGWCACASSFGQAPPTAVNDDARQRTPTSGVISTIPCSCMDFEAAQVRPTHITMIVSSPREGLSLFPHRWVR